MTRDEFLFCYGPSVGLALASALLLFIAFGGEIW